jgi:ABC-2 type transport system ATP-binding protein
MPSELLQQTGTEKLEDAFLRLTGSAIRDERAGASDQMRQFVRSWRR